MLKVRQRPLAGAQVSVAGQAGKEAAHPTRRGGSALPEFTGTNVTVSVRALGYRPDSQTVAVGATNVSFVLSQRAVELNQVVVTGTAGGEQLRSLGTSVATVNVADVTAKTAVPSVEALLNGRTPGVVVMPGTGQVGAGANIRVRGIGTFSLSSQPLVYVDGVASTTRREAASQCRRSAPASCPALTTSTPSEIESMEVLKGPRRHVYGTEAARGVINIITRRAPRQPPSYGVPGRGGSNGSQNSLNRIHELCVQLSQRSASIRTRPRHAARSQRREAGGCSRHPALPERRHPQTTAGNVSGGSALFPFLASVKSAAVKAPCGSNSRRQTEFDARAPHAADSRTRRGNRAGVAAHVPA
jgi:outer membrane receptor protein involved in Fe transport